MKMGQVVITIKLVNYSDTVLKRAGVRKAKPRTAVVEALVDTGATGLYLKPSIIKKLGLHAVEKIVSRTTNGKVQRNKFEAVDLEILGRHETFQAVESPEDVPNLVGQIPLEALDFVVDPKRQRLIGNPEHGGVQMTEVFGSLLER